MHLLSQQYLKYFNYSKCRYLCYLDIMPYHRVSNTFPPAREAFQPKPGPGTLSPGHQLMFDNGIISHQNYGLFAFLPVGLRALDKLIQLIDFQMKKINGQKLTMPSLTSASLWEKSGRLEMCGSEVMRLYDRHNQTLILSPTHEEPITKMVSQADLSLSRLPLKLYQITPKFRDEAHPKNGLMRSREFLMKDMYTFDATLINAKETFKKLCTAYSNILNILNVPFKEVEAAVGTIGGIKSHEFHVPLDLGEDVLLSCKACDYIMSSELAPQTEDQKCPNCKSNLLAINGSEVAHAFLLGTKYSSVFSANYKCAKNKLHILQMGCYGIGITRLLSVMLELHSNTGRLIWPSLICPFKVCIIPPKKGSKEAVCSHWCDHFEHHINKMSGYEDEVIVDDRIKETIGKRFNDARKFGYPVTIIIGKKANADVPLFEVFINKTNQTFMLTQLGVLELLEEFENDLIKTSKLYS